MSIWKYGPAGLVIVTVALMTVPDMMKERTERATKAESEALIQEVEKKLATQEAQDRSRAESKPINIEEEKEKIAREIYEYMIQEQKKCKSAADPNACIDKLNKQLGLK